MIPHSIGLMLVMMEERSTHAPASVEVRGWRDGRVAMRQVCESEDEAVALAEQWAELGLSRIEIDDLSVRHENGEILEPDIEIEPPGADNRSGV